MKTIEHMKSTFIRNYCIIAVFVFPAILSAKGSNPPIELWYDQPADEWMKSTPVGNGRLGAMVYGGVLGEIIAINVRYPFAYWRLETKFHISRRENNQL